eukprot:scaffold7436_cov403-Prasinococcus_capsulatus_cf.AAC.2
MPVTTRLRWMRVRCSKTESRSAPAQPSTTDRPARTRVEPGHCGTSFLTPPRAGRATPRRGGFGSSRVRAVHVSTAAPLSGPRRG